VLTEIRQLTDADALAYHELRLRGLREHPEAFTSSFEDESRKPLDWAQSGWLVLPRPLTTSYWERSRTPG
jgi:hypothetical protein